MTENSLTRLSIRNRSGLILTIITFIIFNGCGEVRNIFREESPRDRYEEMISRAGLMETSLGKQWKSAGDSILLSPVDITLPYREEGYFPQDKTDAVSFRFMGRKGETLRIRILTDTLRKMQVFTDLFISGEETESKPERAAYADNNTGLMKYEVEDNKFHILRLQPELLKNVKYTLIIEAGPSLAFPVAGKNSKAITSYFGDRRDGGARRHEGVDIFAPKRTPVLASAPGIITGTGNYGIGGKVVWLSTGLNRRLYYAHLDTQFVSAGRKVKTGDTLGLVGNTGNARFTPPHLHFGIYISGEGAVNPYPFIADITDFAKPVTADTSLVGKTARIKVKSSPVEASLADKGKTVATLKKNSIVEIEAASGSLYRVKLPDGQRGYVKSASAEAAYFPLSNITAAKAVQLLDYPGTEGQTIATIPLNEDIRLLGEYNGFYLARTKSFSGWIDKKQI